MKFAVDTNVLVVANVQSPQASPECVNTCIHQLREIQLNHTIVLDIEWHIMREYQAKANPAGQPGVGDAFLRWILINQANSERCEFVSITLKQEREDDTEFEEFPNDPQLAGFDRSDCKFVAVALAHPEKPPILNAVDRDWWNYRHVLLNYDLRIIFLCQEAMA
jgi:hypothetical protein